MSSQRYYGGLIWTNHALDRLDERELTQELASQTFHYPDKIIRRNTNGSTELQRRFGKSVITIVAKQNEHNKWIVLSCWIDPPLPGTADAKRKQNYHSYQKASFWGKVWITILRQLGIMSY